MAVPNRTAAAHVLFASSAVLGGGSLLLLVFFLFAGPLSVVDLGLDDGAALALDAALSVACFVQHSTMTRSGFRTRLSGRVAEAFHGAVYSAASGVVLLAVLVLWQGTTPALAVAPGAARWILRVLFLLALLGFAWGARALGPFDALGLRAARLHLRGKAPREPRFTVRGPYRWVRHPLYFFALVLFWTHPEPTADRVLFNVLWTAWVFVGTVLEERDLVATFGEPYREYRRRVPMLLPYRPWPDRSERPP